MFGVACVVLVFIYSFMGFVLPHPHPEQLCHIDDLTLNTLYLSLSTELYGLRWWLETKPDVNIVFPYYAQMNKEKKKTTRKEDGKQNGRDKVEETKWEKTEVQL